MVTIAVASYNNFSFLDRCLSSCLSQTFKDIEVLLVDDGSTDDTKSLLEKYDSNSKIRIICKENGGLSSSRQMALEKARGEYICFIDGDDFLDLRYVSELYDSITKNNADICACNVKFFKENGDTVMPPFYFANLTDTASVLIKHESLQKKYLDYISFYTMYDSWNKMYRVKFLRDNGLFFKLSKGYNGSDLLFNHKILMHEPSICTCSYIGYNHVLYENSATGRKNKKMQEGNEEIITSLFDESEKLKINNLLFEQLSSLYFKLLRNAFQDGLNSYGYEKETIKNMIYKSKVFEQKHHIRRRIKLKGYWQLKLFVRIKNLPYILLLYFKFRQGRYIA